MPVPRIDFEFDKAETKAGLKPPLMDMLFTNVYDSVARQSANLVRKGSPEALYTPAVRAIVDAALNTVELPEVQPRLPLEVRTRRDIAAWCAEYGTNLALMLQLFPGYYARQSDLSTFLLEDEINNLGNHEYISSLAKAPFGDVMMVSGGALRFMHQNPEILESPADVISRSRGLLAIAGVYKGHALKVLNGLGTPYARPEHFVIAEGKTGLEIDFTDETKRFLKTLRIAGRGCPAGKMRADDGTRTLLEEYWERIVRYLIPDEATALFGK